MKLKYHEDITWEDLPKIESPSHAQFTLSFDLSNPRQKLQIGHPNDPFQEVYNTGSRRKDKQALERLYTKMDEAKVLLVRDRADDIFFNAFIWNKDDNHPDNGYWTHRSHILSDAEYHINLLLQRVKKPKKIGSIKAALTTTSEYGYIPSSQGTSVAEGTVTEAAKIIGKFLYQVGSKTVILSTLTPSTAGGSTTYDIPNEPDLRIYESPTTPPQYQRRVDGEWQATGIRAKEVITDNRVQGYEALSPEDMESLKSTGGIPIPPQDKPTIESYPPDNPPDSLTLISPDNRGQSDTSTMTSPAKKPASIGNPGFNEGSNVRDVVGSPLMYNQSDDDIDTKDDRGTLAQNKLNLTYPVETKPNTAFFWSGKTNGVGGETIARQIAGKNNGTTLEALIENRNIKMPAWDATNPEMVQAWKTISADYATGASGTVRAVVGQNLRSGNIWETSELPALIMNPNVDKIITIDPMTKVEKEIFVRNK